VALRREVADHALGIGALGHAFHVGAAHLVLKLRLHGFAPGVVGESPAAVADRADVDEADAQRLLRDRGSRQNERGHRRDELY
jgi:hypothetical protein